MYMPGLSVRALCSRLYQRYVLTAVRHFNDRMPDRHRVCAFYISYVGLRFCKCLEHVCYREFDFTCFLDRRGYSKVSGLADWSENCK
jgi:hypothetical protein